MKTYKIPVVWSNWGLIEIEANNLEEAVQKVLSPDCGLPPGFYLEDSLEVDHEAINDYNDK